MELVGKRREPGLACGLRGEVGYLLALQEALPPKDVHRHGYR
jgi:hypothetical protein